MAEWITLRAADGHEFQAWSAAPEGRPIGAIVVVQEVFGVNRHIRWVCGQFADLGFHAVAPCVFDRVGGNVELEYTDEGIAEGRNRVAALGFDPALLDIAATAAWLAPRARVGVVGYCWGGTLAFLAATRLALPAVSYYGARSRPFLDEVVRAPLMMHFGRHDPLIPQEFHDEFAARQPAVPVHFYDAGHGFNCNERADFHAGSAALAWRRTIRFFREHLGTTDDDADAGDAPFVLDPRIEADTLELVDLPLCRVRLMDDARFPWLVLVPRIEGLRELYELPPDARAQLMAETVFVQQVMARQFAPDKLNVGALGNVVPQLHVHVIARFETDAAWPGPVWGQGKPERYAPGIASAMRRSLVAAMADPDAG